MSTKYLKILGNFKIKLSGRLVEYTLKQSRKARLIWVKIQPESGLVVTVPLYYDKSHLEKFLISKSDWIIKHLERYEKLNKEMSDNNKRAETIYYLGNKYSLISITGSTERDVTVNKGNKSIYFPLKNKDTDLNEHLVKWLKNECRSFLEWKTNEFCNVIPVKYNRIYIRDQKTRWGSCSVKKNLSFNWRIIMMPERVIDYIIIHELCHLKYMDHSHTFWNMVAKYSPDWKLQRKWLRSHHLELRQLI